MSTLKSSAEDLTLNADGSGNDIIFQSNGSNVATLDQAGTLTATTFTGAATDSTKLPLAGGTLTGDVSLVKASGNSQILVEASGTDAYATVRVKNDAKDYSMQIRSDQGDAWTVRDETVGANRIKVDGSTGDTILGGDLVFETAGKGICLGVTSNTDANTLDDYEEGTFTAATAGSTYNTNTGYYRKVGSLVYIQLWVSVDTRTSGSRVEIGGLPFTSINISSGDGHFPISATRFSSLHTAVTALYPMVINNSTSIKCDALTSTANAGVTSNIDTFDSGAAIYFGGCYIAV